MGGLLDKLKGGNLRSIGKSDEVAAELVDNPGLFPEVFIGMSDNDPLVRMRASDAVEKYLRINPGIIMPFKEQILNNLMKIEQQEVRWHVALMLKNLELTEIELNNIISELLSWINHDKSKIVKVNSMQALFDLAERNKEIRPLVLVKLEEFAKTGTPAMIARAKKLLRNLSKLK